MRGTTRTTTIAAAVAAGALVLGGTATAVAAGQGWGQQGARENGAAAAGLGKSGMGNSGQGKSSRDGACDAAESQDHRNAGKGNAGNRRGGTGAGQRGSGSGSGHQDAASLELGTLTGEQEAEMAFMAEEEKMAGDLYEAFFEMYGVKVFSNMAASEDRHADAVRDLLDAYGLDDPTVGLAAGEFTIPEVQQTYDDLLAQGSASVEAALEVGVIVEETDIADLQEAVDELDAPRAVAVYDHLLAGSRNHLNAFSR